MKKIILALILTLVCGTVYADFSDIAGHWGAEAIEWASSKAIVNGYPDSSFKPDGAITRAEALKTLYLLYGVKAEAKYFNDVNKYDWYYEYITTGFSIMPESTDGNFYPDKEITRQDAVYAIVKAKFGDVTPSDIDALSYYNDSYLISDYAKAYISFAKETGLIQGYEDNTIKPTASLTRAEFATILKNADGIEICPEETEAPSENTEQAYISNFIPVMSVSVAENDNGVQVTKISGLKYSGTVELISTEGYENNVKTGDTIIPQLNHKGLVRKCSILATVENNTVIFGKDIMQSVNGKYNKTKYYYGEIESIEKGKFVTLKNNSLSSGSNSLEFEVDGNAEIYFYNTALKSKNRLYTESLDVLSFESGKAYERDNEVAKIYIVARETDGEVTEATVYIMKKEA